MRFDGGHKHDAFLTGTFGRFVEWVPVCPEVECGFGTPREAMRLVRAKGGVRLLTVKTLVNLTDRMDRYAERRVAQLAPENLSCVEITCSSLTGQCRSDYGSPA